MPGKHRRRRYRGQNIDNGEKVQTMKAKAHPNLDTVLTVAKICAFFSGTVAAALKAVQTFLL
jgi:hypothetical protein